MASGHAPGSAGAPPGASLASRLCARLGPALQGWLGEDCFIVDEGGLTLFGSAAEGVPRVQLAVGPVPVGWLGGASADPAALCAAGQLLSAFLSEMASLPASGQPNQAERQLMLYEAEKLASVGRLAAGMAHEINNPLSFVRSNLGTFRKYLAAFADLKEQLDHAEAAWDVLDLDFVLEDCRQLLDESGEGLLRIGRIVSDLRQFSSVDQRGECLVDLNECLRSAARMLELECPPTITLAFDLRPLPAMLGLPGHLNQMFYNILHNALQAIQDARRVGSIAISSAPTADSIRIEIRDNGVGMAPAEILHAFEPFFTARRIGSGSGLGLTTALHIAQAHSGRIDIRSRPGDGTTLRIEFPRRPGQPPGEN